MSTTKAMTAAIIGGGKMGGDIAAVLATGGWEVHHAHPLRRSRMEGQTSAFARGGDR